MKEFSPKCGSIKGTLTRFWPLWPAFFLAWCLTLIVPLATVVNWAAGNQTASAINETMTSFWYVERLVAIMVTFIAGALATTALHEHLFRKPAAMFYGSLPTTRTQTFVWFYAAGLLPLLAVEAIVAMIVGIIGAPSSAVSAVDCISWFALTASSTFVFYSLAVFCANLCGNRPAAIALYVVLNILAECICEAVLTLACGMMVGVVVPEIYEAVSWASPVVGMLILVAQESISWTGIAVFAALAAVLTGASLALYRARNLESAGDTVAFGILKPLLTHLTGLSSALLGGMVAWFFVASFEASSLYFDDCLTLKGAVFTGCLMVAGGFLGELFSNMAVNRTSKALRASLPGTAVLTVVSIAFVLCCHADLLGIARHVPQVDEVAAVTLGYHNASVSSEENIGEAIALHEDLLERSLEMTEAPDDSSYHYVEINYQLKSGREMKRCYLIYYKEDGNDANALSLLLREEALLNSTEALHSLFDPLLERDDLSIMLDYAAESGEYRSITLKGNEAKDFVETALKPDIFENGAGDTTVFGDAEYDIDATIGLGANETGEISQFVAMSSSHTPNCIAWLEKNKGITLRKYESGEEQA